MVITLDMHKESVLDPKRTRASLPPLPTVSNFHGHWHVSKFFEISVYSLTATSLVVMIIPLWTPVVPYRIGSETLSPVGPGYGNKHVSIFSLPSNDNRRH